MSADWAWGALAIIQSGLLVFAEVRAARDRRQDDSDRRIAEGEWRVERGQLIDRIQSGDITQYHALQNAYYTEQQVPEVHDWNHDDFGFVSEPRSATDPEG